MFAEECFRYQQDLVTSAYIPGIWKLDFDVTIDNKGAQQDTILIPPTP